jgi:4-amino-4-deoxy-L-arabinose transferase-like glycosyltransferase
MLSRRTTRVVFILILILAAALRLYRIDAQSLWNDEGNSARLAERSAQLILEGAAGDIHPPLYYLTLHVWRSLFGYSEAALRGLSVVFGLIAVAFTYLLGRRVFDKRVGLIGALLAATNPFQIYYSQEARMYMMLAAIGVVATYILVRLLDFWSLHPRIYIPHRRYYVLYVVAMAAGLYTHYAFPFVFVVHFVIVLAWSLYRPGGALSRIGSWLPLAIAAGALFLPWLPTALRQISGWPSQAASIDAGGALIDTFRLYLLGPTSSTEQAATPLIIAGFFLAMSLWTPDSFDEPEPDWDTTAPRALRFGAVALYLLVPIALIFSLGLLKDAYLKFLLVGSPAFCLLLARGLDNSLNIARGAMSMPRELTGPREIAFSWVAVVAILAALVLLPTVVSLGSLYFEPAYARDDYRSIARTIESTQRSGDAVVLHAANQWEVFTYYYPDSSDVFPIVKQRPLDPAATNQELVDIITGHRRLFVIYWSESDPDPTRFVETWLDKHTYKAGDTWYGNVRLAMYAVPIQMADTPGQKTDARLGDHIWLDGYSLLTPAVAPGDIVQIALFWRCDTHISDRYKVFVHLVSADGSIVAQTDREPGGDLTPTTIWKPGETIVDRYGVAIPATVASGTYRLVVGMYSFDGKRLRVTNGGVDIGDAVTLGEISVKP